MNARHSAKSVEWYTPPAYVEAAREVMGSIDLDPASCAEANKGVGATLYFDEADDGLTLDWGGNVFLNPPGGKNANGSLVNQFWIRFVDEIGNGHCTQGVWIGYSLEQLQTIQRVSSISPIMGDAICIPNRRIAFIGKGGSPTHANYITYIGPHVETFAGVFGQFGQVRL